MKNIAHQMNREKNKTFALYLYPDIQFNVFKKEHDYYQLDLGKVI